VYAVVDGEAVTVGLAFDDLHALITLGGESHRLAKPPPPDVDGAGPGGADAPGAGLRAPMPGTVVKVLVGEGDEVEEGQLLLILEAMKMEQPIAAPRAGRVASLPFGEGALVPGGAVLAEIEEA
jgi:3-methylcrotonyl-CoA carboxylase alpha subunit